jgi:hypothetical protein
MIIRSKNSSIKRRSKVEKKKEPRIAKNGEKM